MPSSSSDSEDDRLKGVRKPPPPTGKAPPIPKKTHVIRSSMQKRRLQCAKLVRNKWFIIGMSAFILLLIVAIVLGVTLGGKKSSYMEYEEQVPLKWWQNSTIYRIYVNSFSDSDGDGLGDFKGIQERLNYLKELGIDVIWLSPIQNTNTVSGTDVIDFKNVKTVYGSLEDFRGFLEAAKEMGIKVIMDLILNHSGTAHKWFKQSQLSTPPFRDYYIWNKGKSTGIGTRPQPPNNWVSLHNGSAWYWNDNRGEYHLRQFWKTEPDLNYRNPQIVQEMKAAASFWLDMGLDGFYLRDSPFLCEDAQYTDESQISGSLDYASLSHNYTRDLADSYQVVNDIFIGTIQPRLGEDRVLLLETNDRVMGDERVSQTYNLMTTSALYKLDSTFDGLQLKTAVHQSLESFNKTKMWPIWKLGDEEKSRISSKFNQLAPGLQIIQILLPGSPSIYYGEEIQLTNHQSIKYEETVDVVAKDAGASNYTFISRDPFRTPMKWSSTRHAGFTTATTPWLPVNNNDPTVDLQKSRTNSIWWSVKDFIEMKKSSVTLTNGTIDFPMVSADIFSFTRIHQRNNTGFLIVWNVGNQRQTLSFNDTPYMSNDMTVVRKIRPNEGSRTETTIVKKSEVTVEPKELIVFSFWKQ